MSMRPQGLVGCLALMLSAEAAVGQIGPVVIEGPRPFGYFLGDVIALDIDNGTTAMVKNENNQLYSAAGLRQLALALKPGGRAAIWSACPDAALEKRLQRTGLAVQAVPAKLHEHAKRSAYMIYVADKAVAEAVPPKSSV